MGKGPKTHSGASKRIKLTKGGKKGAKLLFSHAGKGHLRRTTTASNRRNQGIPVVAKGGNLKNIKRLLGV